MTRLALLVALAACGGGHGRSTMPTAQSSTIGLVTNVALDAWYRSPAPCGQGPYEIAIPPSASKWGEQVELRLHAPHGVALHAVLLVDDVEVARTSGAYDTMGSNARVDNTRCLADKRERVALGRAGGGGGRDGSGGTPVATGTQTPVTTSTTAQLELVQQVALDSTSVLVFRLPRASSKIVLRLWSIEPNDLEGVLFGVTKIVWRPNVPEAEYEAHLARLEVEARERAAREEAERVARAEREAAERARQREALRVKQEQNRLRREAELRVRLEREREATVCRLEASRRSRGEQVEPGSAAHIELCRRIAIEDEQNRRAYQAELAAAERERLRALADAPRREAEERRARDEANRRAEQAAREAEERARAAQLKIALEIKQRREREQFCASHPGDRGCWGAGGMKVHLELEARRREREQFCTAHSEDARCWSSERWERLRSASKQRIEVALTPAAKPEGPPPAPLAEEMPPKLSAHAEWRPGYWHWLDGSWVWLAGMWRVPEADIVAEQTTTAPAAPPPLRVEAPPPPPARSAVWLAGFWQWNGTSWVWIAGSYQLRPATSVTWRAPEWRARGGVHVLIPGGWIRVGGSR